MTYIILGLIANIVHISLNARGGGERLAVATIKAISSMGIGVELSTVEKPDMALIHDAYGTSVSEDIKKVRTLNILQKYGPRNYTFTVNTHGDMLPFYHKDFTKKNAITYCHYPIARYLIDCGDPDYSAVLQNMCLLGMTSAVRNGYHDVMRSAYVKMMLNSTVLTNSEFSRKAIFKTFGVDSTILPPPVDVDIFRNACLASNVRNDSILVISRFHPSKKIENAIHLAKLLCQNEVGICMNIVGNMPSDGIGYFNYLNDLVRHCGLENFVRFEINVRFDRLLDLMRRSKVYVHPLPGEPFGISTVEAMSAGIIPVVPDIGGHTEFVPARYQFHTYGEGVQAVAAALAAPASERIKLSHSTQKYSVTNYIEKFQQILVKVMDISRKRLESNPVISLSKRQPESLTT
ncbi:MAG: glycosyltransferase family 4 protein [Thermoproteota archaeon]|nr:glycosyltransferase family 4 protein [Thermoproteota archaeon]